jgi:hypothetical protein
MFLQNVHKFLPASREYAHSPMLYLITAATTTTTNWGYAVAQMVEALRYKPEGRGFDSRWCHRNFSLT